VMDLFKECRLEDMPPHIYAVANSAYRSMIRTKKDQSIIFIGRSGNQCRWYLDIRLRYLPLFDHSTFLSTFDYQALLLGVLLSHISVKRLACAFTMLLSYFSMCLDVTYLGQIIRPRFKDDFTVFNKERLSDYLPSVYLNKRRIVHGHGLGLSYIQRLFFILETEIVYINVFFWTWRPFWAFGRNHRDSWNLFEPSIYVYQRVWCSDLMERARMWKSDEDLVESQ